MKHEQKQIFYFFDNALKVNLSQERGSVIFDLMSSRFHGKGQSLDGVAWINDQISNHEYPGDNLELLDSALFAMHYVREYGKHWHVKIQLAGKESVEQKEQQQVKEIRDDYLDEKKPQKEFVAAGHTVLFTQGLSNEYCAIYQNPLEEKKLKQKIALLVREYEGNPSDPLKEMIRRHLKMYQVQYAKKNGKRLLSLVVSEIEYIQKIYLLIQQYKEKNSSSKFKEKIQIHLALLQKYWGKKFSDIISKSKMLTDEKKSTLLEIIKPLENYALQNDNEKTTDRQVVDFTQNKYAFDLVKDLDKEKWEEKSQQEEQAKIKKASSLWSNHHYVWDPLHEAFFAVVKLFSHYRQFRNNNIEKTKLTLLDFPQYTEYCQQVEKFIRLLAPEFLSFGEKNIVIGGELGAYLPDIYLAIMDKYYSIIDRKKIDVREMLACLKNKIVIVEEVQSLSLSEEGQKKQQAVKERELAWQRHGKYAEVPTSNLIIIAQLVNSAFTSLSKITGRRPLIQQQIDLLAVERKTIARSLALRLACYWEEGHDDLLYLEQQKLQVLGLETPISLPQPETTLLDRVKINYPVATQTGKTEESIRKLITKQYPDILQKNNIAVALQFILQHGDIEDQLKAIGIPSVPEKTMNEQKTKNAISKKYRFLLTTFFHYRLQMSHLERSLGNQEAILLWEAAHSLDKIYRLRKKLHELQKSVQRMKITPKSGWAEQILSDAINQHVYTVQGLLQQHLESNLEIYYQYFQLQDQGIAKFLQFIKDQIINLKILQKFLLQKTENIKYENMADFEYFIELTMTLRESQLKWTVKDIHVESLQEQLQVEVDFVVNAIVSILDQTISLKNAKSHFYENRKFDLGAVLNIIKKYGAHPGFKPVQDAFKRYVKKYQGQDNEYLDIALLLDQPETREAFTIYAQKRFAYLLKSDTECGDRDERLFDYAIFFYPEIFDDLWLEVLKNKNTQEISTQWLKRVLQYASPKICYPILKHIFSINNTDKRAKLVSQFTQSKLWQQTQNKSRLITVLEKELAYPTEELCWLGHTLAQENENKNEQNKYFAHWLTFVLRNPENCQQQRCQNHAQIAEQFADLSDADKFLVFQAMHCYLANNRHRDAHYKPLTELSLAILKRHPFKTGKQVKILTWAAHIHQAQQTFYQEIEKILSVDQMKIEEIEHRIDGMMNGYHNENEKILLQQDFLQGLYQYFLAKIEDDQNQIQNIPSSQQLLQSEHKNSPNFSEHSEELAKQVNYLLNRKGDWKKLMTYIEKCAHKANISLRAQSFQKNAFQLFLKRFSEQQEEPITIDAAAFNEETLSQFVNAVEITQDKKSVLEKLNAMMLQFQKVSEEEKLSPLDTLIFAQAAEVLREILSTALAVDPVRGRTIHLDNYTKKMIARLQALLNYQKNKKAEELIRYFEKDLDFLIGKVRVYQFLCEGKDAEPGSLQTVIDYLPFWEQEIQDNFQFAVALCEYEELKNAVDKNFDSQKPDKVSALFSKENIVCRGIKDIFAELEELSSLSHGLLLCVSTQNNVTPEEILKEKITQTTNAIKNMKITDRTMIMEVLYEKYQELDGKIKRTYGSYQAQSELYFYASLQTEFKELIHLLLSGSEQEKELWDTLFQQLTERQNELVKLLVTNLLSQTGNIYNPQLKVAMEEIEKAEQMQKIERGFTPILKSIRSSIDILLKVKNLPIAAARQLLRTVHGLLQYLTDETVMSKSDYSQQTISFTDFLKQLVEIKETVPEEVKKIEEEGLRVVEVKKIATSSSSRSSRFLPFPEKNIKKPNNGTCISDSIHAPQMEKINRTDNVFSNN